MSSILTIARAELLRALRSRSAIITSFLAPVALAVVFGVMFSSSNQSSFSIGVVDDASTSISQEVARSLLDSTDEQVDFVVLDDRAAAVEAVDDETVGAAIVLQAGTTAPLGLVVVENLGSPVSSQVAQSIATGIATSIETGGQPSVAFAPVDVGGRELSAPAYFGASMAILLLFFSTGMAAQSILEDKQSRTLDRILSGPTTLWSVLIGKVLAVSVLAVGGFVTVWSVTAVLFGANWGNPASVAILIICTVIALSGIATFVGGFAKTPQQAATFTAVVTFALSLLGGNFTGPSDAPQALRVMRRLTPNGRALEAFTELSVDASSLGSIGLTLVILLGSGFVFGAIGLANLHRSVGT